MEKEFIITSQKQYQETLAAIYEMMNKGEENLTKTELEELGLITKAAEKYEDATP